MRANSRSPFQKIIDAGAREALALLARRGLLTGANRYGASTPPRTVTTAGTNEDGEVFTIRPFMLNVDALNSPSAALHVEGNVKDYGS